MATKLTKTIRRETLRMTETHGAHKGKPIIVELLPGDEISFKVKGTRQECSIYLGHCFMLAKIQTMEANYKAAMERWRNRGTKRTRKPRRPSLPFGNMYFKALKP